jgi:hypothetical protein
VQATVSVLCQIIFLTTSAGKKETNESGQAKALFAMNITFAVLGSVSGLLTLCLKDSLLSRLESEEGGGDNKNRGTGRSAGEAKNGLVVTDDGEEEDEVEEEREFRFANLLYGNDNDGDAEMAMANVVNPMVAAAAGTRSSIGNDHEGDEQHAASAEAVTQRERKLRLERELEGALAKNTEAKDEVCQLEADNARLIQQKLKSGDQGVVVAIDIP